MRERNPNILIMGAGASQPVNGEHLVHPDVTGPEGVRPYLTFYDPNPNVSLREDMPHLNAARLRGEVDLTHEMPRDEFDVAVIATSSEHHTEAIQAILETHTTPPLFVLQKPLATTHQEVDQLKNIEAWVQPRSVTDEPFLLSRGMHALAYYALGQEEAGNEVREIKVWSSKRRKKANPHGDLGIFGIELPHLHGGASYLTGEILGLSPETRIDENIYFADVDGIPNNDGNYLRFISGERVIHVAQGLGRFAMDGYGGMIRNDAPPRIRRSSVRFEDGQYFELDVDTAFPAPGSNEEGFSTIWHFGREGELVNQITIPDNPRIELARYVLRRTKDDSIENISNVTMTDALTRSEALLYLRENTEVRQGILLS